MLCTVSVLLLTMTFPVEARTAKRYIEKFDQTFPIGGTATLIISNTVGRIEVIGSSASSMSLQAVRVTDAFDEKAVEEAVLSNPIIVGGSGSNRIIRSLGVPERNGRWSSHIDYLIRVPPGVQLRIFNTSSERISVTNILGTVFVRNTHGRIELNAPLGVTTVDTINGNVVASFGRNPASNTSIRTVNGSIDLRVPTGSRFAWLAETLKGDIRTTIPAQGTFDPNNSGTFFRGIVNGPGGPTIETATMTGQVLLLLNGQSAESARSLIAGSTGYAAVAEKRGPKPVLQRTVSIGSVAGNYDFSTMLGSVSVLDVRGDAKVFTRAGEIALGRVLGRANVVSLGGPLNLGDVGGELKARTSGGDIFIRAARKGGEVFTEGGNVQLLFSAGPITLGSGGGDIIVRQASGPVRAETDSGDISINLDPNLKTQRVWAKTGGGNLILNLPAGFGAEVDATIITDDGNINAIRTDLPGLMITRDKVGNRTRIRAVGRILGGGEKIVLHAEGGDIRILSQPVPRLMIIPDAR
ncbi:MAG TPA: hypothetical protein VNM92_01810 [Thermoanaerobaculia bacterium]|nr:hypothetical protein [Thermoanaerobaculia bacterium]